MCTPGNEVLPAQCADVGNDILVFESVSASRKPDTNNSAQSFITASNGYMRNESYQSRSF